MNSAINNRRIEHLSRTRRIKLYSWLGGAIIVLCTLAYIIFRSPVFKIREFIVESSRPIDTGQLVKTLKAQIAGTRLGGIFGTDHSFAWNHDINYSAPEFSGITIEKTLFSKTILIKTIARERFAVWCQTSDTSSCYWVDETGVLHENALETTGQLILTVREGAPTAALTPGEKVVSEEAFSYLRSILATLTTLNAGVRGVAIDRSKDELRVDTYADAEIQFSLRFDPTPTALPALKRIIRTPGLRGLEYVNLTVENRVFYKPK